MFISCRYHKDPGDVCVGGFMHEGKRFVLAETCSEGDKTLVKKEMHISNSVDEVSMLLISGFSASDHFMLIKIYPITCSIMLLFWSLFCINILFCHYFDCLFHFRNHLMLLRVLLSLLSQQCLGLLAFY